MLTFERLVFETTRRLSGNTPPVNEDTVRHVLSDVGIDEVVRHVTPSPQGRLIVHYVHIVGMKRRTDNAPGDRFEYTRKLGTGLWAWVGENGSGKSTILSCILWALTGADTMISKRMRSWIDDVLVHFSVGEQRFTSRVMRTTEGGSGSSSGINGGLYHDFITFNDIDMGRPEPVALFHSRDEMREMIDLFFMQHLGITTLRWTAHSPAKDDPDLHAHSTTWRTYAHAIHIQDDSYDDLIIDPQKGYGRQDRKILEMMLGIDYARAVSEIQVQADFAKESLGRARSRVSGRRTDAAEQITALQHELAETDSALANFQADQTPVEDDRVLVETREQRAKLLAEQNRLAEEIAAIEAQQSALEREILNAERDKMAIREQSEVEYLVNSLAVVRCPHCELAVDAQERLESEKHSHTCHVCQQPLQRTRQGGDLKTILKDRDAEIVSMKSTIKRLTQQRAEHLEKFSVCREQASKLGETLENTVQQARQGFTESYSNLLRRKGQIEGQIEQLQRELTAIESEQSEVDAAALWFTILSTAAQIADEIVFNLHQSLFEELTRIVVHLATQFGVPDVENVFIDEKRFVKIVQGGMVVMHNDLARSERVKFKVAFHLALALLQVRAGMGKHPGLLLLDTPGTAEIDDVDYAAMARDLANIHAEYGENLQLLLATARPEALDHLPGEVVESPRVAGRFF